MSTDRGHTILFVEEMFEFGLYVVEQMMYRSHVRFPIDRSMTHSTLNRFSDDVDYFRQIIDTGRFVQTKNKSACGNASDCLVPKNWS